MTKVLEVNVDDLHYGGVFKLIKDVIENINAMPQRDVQIDIASIEKFEDIKNMNLLKSMGAQVYYIGFQRNKLIKQFVCMKKLQRVIKEGNYDIVHIHGDVANKLFVSGVAAKMVGCNKIVFHSHAAGIDGDHRKIKYYIHKIIRPLLKYIGTTFVSCSDLASEWMYPNIEKKEIKCIHNGVNLDKFRFNPESRKKIREKLGLHNEILIGHVGRFAYQKNHEYLIKVFKQLLSQVNNVKLILVGEGELEESIKEQARQDNLTDNVIFYGTSHVVNQLLQAMDVFVLPSYFEGLPIGGVEAQAAGLPVIFSNKITQEAKISDNVIFLPIDSNSIQLWVAGIIEFSSFHINRQNGYIALKKQGFDIHDTIKEFISLYK